MALPGNKNFSDYDNYITDQNPTTSAQAQDYFRNQAELLKAVIDCDFWQPKTVYQPGDVVKSDSMPNGTEAVMVATKASVTSNVEPQWGAVGGANISDGACFWKLRWQHWSKEVASVDDMKNGTSNDKLVTPKLARLGQTATNRLPNTAYSEGNVVYDRSNLSVALKCTSAGTTSNTELDISTRAVGESVEDGSVVWEVVSRDTVATIDKQRPIKTFTSLEQLGLDNNANEEDVALAMPFNSMLLCNILGYSGTNPNFAVGKNDGMLKVSRVNDNNVKFEFIAYGGGNTILKMVASYTSWASKKFSGWEKVATNGALSMPSSQRISIAMGDANYEPYTAPADGWLVVVMQVVDDGVFGFELLSQETKIQTRVVSSSAKGQIMSAYCPLSKGTLATSYVYNMKRTESFFVYAQSEV